MRGRDSEPLCDIDKKKLKMSVQDKANVKANKKEVIDPVSRIAN